MSASRTGKPGPPASEIVARTMTCRRLSQAAGIDGKILGERWRATGVSYTHVEPELDRPGGAERGSDEERPLERVLVIQHVVDEHLGPEEQARGCEGVP